MLTCIIVLPAGLYIGLPLTSSFELLAAAASLSAVGTAFVRIGPAGLASSFSFSGGGGVVVVVVAALASVDLGLFAALAGEVVVVAALEASVETFLWGTLRMLSLYRLREGVSDCQIRTPP